MFVLEWFFLILIRLVLILAGLVVVPLALPFREMGTSVSDGRRIVVLPKWAWLWSNDFDGAQGDKRGWWKEHAPFGLGAAHWFSMFVWLAIRNPVNNLRRTDWYSCPVSECDIWFAGKETVEDKPGMTGWQFVTAEHFKSESQWHGFYLVHPWTGFHAFVIRVGFKIKPSHEGTLEPRKGFTVRINPWKSI